MSLLADEVGLPVDVKNIFNDTCLQLAEPNVCASANALNFLDSITNEDLNLLCFDETLHSFSETGIEIGLYKCSINRCYYDNVRCFSIEAKTDGLIGNVACGTSVEAIVSTNLTTFTHTMKEYIKLENHPIERTVIIKRSRLHYDVTTMFSEGEKSQTLSRKFEHSQFEGFISEGANLLLRRLLVTKSFPSCFEVIGFDSKCNICQLLYLNLGERTQRVAGEDITVVGIHRKIQSVYSISSAWQSFVMKDGHLISRIQMGSPITLKVKSIPKLIQPLQYLPQSEIQPDAFVWEEDIELFSKYLSRKEDLTADYLLYLRNHPDVRLLLADFVQALLLKKPADTVQFARDFFTSFSARKVPVPPFLSSQLPS